MRRGQWGGCVGPCSIGTGQNGVVGVHNGLYLGRGVCQCAVDNAAVQGGVDGIQVAGADTGYARSGKDTGSQGRAYGTVCLCCVADGGQGSCRICQCGIDKRLQFGARIEGRVGGGGLDGNLHGGQICGRYASDTECCQVCQTECCGLGCGATG